MDRLTDDFSNEVDLAAERLGGAVLYANDDFFAPKENLLKPAAAVFLEHEYTDRGKWMDGWESRRKRGPGHDFCLIRLGVPGRIRGVVVDTAFFRGNYPEHCSLEGCASRTDASVEELLDDKTLWIELLAKSALKGDSKNPFAIQSAQRITHLRFNIFPDGGVARLRVHGEPVPDWRSLGKVGREIDLVAIENGGKVPECSDMFFGVRHNLVMPGRAPNMGDGWETKRRRGPGYDWALVDLAAEGEIARIEVDTNHFKGNYPDTCMIEGRDASGAWRETVAKTKLQASTRHFFEEEIQDRGPFVQLRLNIYPDGGVSRLRVWGTVTREAAALKRLARLNALSAREAERELLGCCGSTEWAKRVAAARPFANDELLLRAADMVWRALGPNEWMEAFKAHPKIGEKEAAHDRGAAARAWSNDEQAGTRAASEAAVTKLAGLNKAYEERLGFIFIICATGLSAEQIIEAAELRIHHGPDDEVVIAAEEQRKITKLRLEKMLGQ